MTDKMMPHFIIYIRFCDAPPQRTFSVQQWSHQNALQNAGDEWKVDIRRHAAARAYFYAAIECAHGFDDI